MNKINVSLEDTAELKQLILDNPDLPLVVFAGEYCNSGTYGYEFCDVSSVCIQDLAMVGDMYVERENYTDELYCHLDINGEYSNLPKNEFEALVDKMVEKTEFTKAIVINIG